MILCAPLNRFTLLDKLFNYLFFQKSAEKACGFFLDLPTMASLLFKLGKVRTVAGIAPHSGSLAFGGASEGALLVDMRYLLICI